MDRLSALPTEILILILSFLWPLTDGHNFLLASKRFYNYLISDLWKEYGRQANWYPLFAAARRGNIPLMQKCLDAGAKVDTCWNSRHLSFGISVNQRPLRGAIFFAQLEAVEWLLDHGADPNNTYDEVFKSTPLNMARDWFNIRQNVVDFAVRRGERQPGRRATMAQRASGIVDALIKAGAT
ncbi:hypothetical protein FALBO_8583 [Fusarium albosuccineum]|uniref:F-box domain-containing protein n=1 Tax=Fusarium albosuccineum TaxID=1237068 RepID=A0A8H4LBL3_9HYPO|nr:hypothetical protein FALBO_8583 [Fusarium albosuccineum]